MTKIKRVLISVSDKTGVADFAKSLADYDVNFLSTGGTAKTLREIGLNVTDVAEYTGFPEMMDGRVKTLHPKIHGALLGVRDNPEHLAKMQEYQIVPIDMVVINLYPFKKTIAKPECTLPEAIENIDIGGPAMLRSAAKNYKSVTVIVDPADYAPVLQELEWSGGEMSEESNMKLASKVFETTSAYDAMIMEYLKTQCK